MASKFLDNFNKNFGKLFFGNPNTLYYNIFNKYHGTTTLPASILSGMNRLPPLVHQKKFI